MHSENDRKNTLLSLALNQLQNNADTLQNNKKSIIVITNYTSAHSLFMS